ncbi:predicted protein [Streptomyces viridochromogenes DSM 40736]|uniref:Predicted protein n=1 Tax=Streptomyces viridochromogenes (strain DSM 40736 / JCM 4977 / BCRC 1201 / Tue 494) TaxID=591159 RepID=D9XH98_STRVT|nr:predicted protein [Streptomyces viridochromogenes DSM 40736]
MIHAKGKLTIMGRRVPSPQTLHPTRTSPLGDRGTCPPGNEGAVKKQDLHATDEPLETKDLHATSEPFKPTK